MSTKKQTTPILPKGEKISEQENNATTYIKFYEFLLFDPNYRGLSEKAKLLYSYLRSRVSYFEFQTKSHEKGIEGTKSYRDEEGFIYCVSDNTELEYILKATEPTVINLKQELEMYGLLSQQAVKDKANRLYVLKPKKVAEKWTYIEEIKKLRKQKEEANKIKRQKQKEKRQKQKEQKSEKASKPQNVGDLNNASHRDSKNLSHGDLNNLSKIQSKSLNSNLSSKIKLNQSISEEEINNSILPEPIKASLHKEIDRLIYHNLSMLDVFNNYELHKESATDAQYIAALEYALQEKQIKNFSNLMATNVTTQLSFAANRSVKQTKSTRKEIMPEKIRQQQELEEQKEAARKNEKTIPAPNEDELFVEKVKFFFNDGIGTLSAEEIQLAKEKGIVTPEQIENHPKL